MKRTKTDLTEKQERLLIHLVDNRKQFFDLSDAQQVYDTKKHAKSALRTLEVHGFISRVNKGRYKLKGIPPGLKAYVKVNI